MRDGSFALTRIRVSPRGRRTVFITTIFSYSVIAIDLLDKDFRPLLVDSLIHCSLTINCPEEHQHFAASS